MKRRSRSNDNEEDLAGRSACYKGDMYCQGKWGQKGTTERVWDGRGVTCKGRQNVNNKPKQQRWMAPRCFCFSSSTFFFLISFFGFSFPPTFSLALSHTRVPLPLYFSFFSSNTYASTIRTQDRQLLLRAQRIHTSTTAGGSLKISWVKGVICVGGQSSRS